MYGIRFWKGNAAFNRQKDHDFAPNEWFRQTVVTECKFASFDKGGDAEICKKLGFEYPKKCGELLKPYAESYDKDPPDELLAKVNSIFVEEFTTNCLKRLESGELDESVFEEMVKSF